MIRTALLGYPLDHSVSPAMHNAAFSALGLEGRYDSRPTPPEQLALVVAGLASQGYRGANITLPHKQAVMPLLDQVSDAAQAIAAVNTLVIERRGGSTTLRGDNTDWLGFLQPLDARGFDVAGKTALLLGAGGSAYAVVYALIRRGLARLVIAARTPDRAAALARHAAALSPTLSITITDSPFPTPHSPLTINHSPSTINHFPFPTPHSPLTINHSPLTINHFPFPTPHSPLTINHSPLTINHFPFPIPHCHLLINTTPLGMWPHSDASPWPDALPLPAGALIYDLVYRPERTRLLQQAEAAGCATQGGLPMLVEQGAAAFHLWTSHTPPAGVMLAAARAALREDPPCYAS